MKGQYTHYTLEQQLYKSPGSAAHLVTLEAKTQWINFTLVLAPCLAGLMALRVCVSC